MIPVLANKNTIIENYTYDNEGNRVEKSITKNGTVINKTASYTIDNALESIGDTFYTYDDDGYLTSKTDGSQTTTYEYGTNGELRAVTLTDGTSIEYIHNANNQRVAKLVNGEVVEKYLWKDLTTLLAVYRENGLHVTRFSYLKDRVPYKMLHNYETFYLSYNHLGSLTTVTNTQGNTVKEITYDSFGNILSDSNPYLHVNLGFAGGLYDKDTKLTRFGYRDYDAEIGRWTAKDPIGFAGGDTNLYGYVVNDPVNFVDPEGLEKSWEDKALGVYNNVLNFLDFRNKVEKGVAFFGDTNNTDKALDFGDTIAPPGFDIDKVKDLLDKQNKYVEETLKPLETCR